MFRGWLWQITAIGEKAGGLDSRITALQRIPFASDHDGGRTTID
jgi:hypothetical protein